MGRLIIMPTGISLTRKLEKSQNLSLSLGNEAQELKRVLRSTPRCDLEKLSVELSLLTKLGASPHDEVLFLATDTDAGECAARANAVVAKDLFGLKESEVARVKGLVLDDARTFLRQGLPNLFQALDSAVGGALEEGAEPVIGVAGGIKPVLPYVAIYGMLRRVPLVYVFEETQALITLPPLPLGFDWESLERAERVFRVIETQVAIPYRELKGLLGEDFPRLKGLFEEIERDEMTLSAFGHMLLESLKKAQEGPVMLSPRAREVLEGLQGTQRREIELLLDRVRNPIWRAAKWHTRSDTDLAVWKPGANQPRLAGWVEGDTVYVAEIYTTHQEYDRDIPNRRRRNYDPKGFSAYYPRALELAQETLEAAGGDDFLALAYTERDRALRERDEALELAEQYEREVAELREEVLTLKRREEERRSWGLWRRLRWAILGPRE